MYYSEQMAAYLIMSDPNIFFWFIFQVLFVEEGMLRVKLYYMTFFLRAVNGTWTIVAKVRTTEYKP